MRYITCTNPLVRYARVRVRWCFNIFSQLHLPRAITVIPHSATDGDHLNFLVNHLFCYRLGYTFFFFALRRDTAFGAWREGPSTCTRLLITEHR